MFISLVVSTIKFHIVRKAHQSYSRMRNGKRVVQTLVLEFQSEVTVGSNNTFISIL